MAQTLNVPKAHMFKTCSPVDDPTGGSRGTSGEAYLEEVSHWGRALEGYTGASAPSSLFCFLAAMR
jgi:hypothetical protein